MTTIKEHPVIAPKKLIEVALPLDAINEAAAREKSIRHGHPSTLHLYWARRPLAAARAVIFAQMVNDPSWRWDLEHPNEEASPQQRAAWTKARRKLFELIEQLVQWENTNNERVLEAARAEIWKSWRETCEVNKTHPAAKELFNPDKLPGFHDPFAGGGAIPLEAQRLGLDSYATDLNPLAVLINRAMLEVPPRFANRPPVHPNARVESAISSRSWRGAQGIAEDLRHYGKWMRDEAERRIGKLYPKITITSELAKGRADLKPYVGQQLTAIAWLWVRTVKSPNPAFAHVDVPLASTFMLSTKQGKEAYVEPVIDDDTYRFRVNVGKPRDAVRAKNGTKLARGANFECLMSGVPISADYIKAEGKAGRIGSRLMAVVAEGQRGRLYVAPSDEQEMAARSANPLWRPELSITGSGQYIGVRPYGIERFDQLFTDRQLAAMQTLTDLSCEVREIVFRDAERSWEASANSDELAGGSNARDYGNAIAMYLSLAVSRISQYWSNVATWHNAGEKLQPVFGRQAIPMAWDFAEGNPFSDSTGNFGGSLDWIEKCIQLLPANGKGSAVTEDATRQQYSKGRIVSTDPPYYDNVPYADLSDFFYVWLRRSLQPVVPELFTTVAVPKTDELVAFAYRHNNSKSGAERFFLDGMTAAMHQLAHLAHPAFPVTIYYAFKQADGDGAEGTSSTGWETFLAAVIRAGFQTTGTWPMRTEMKGRVRDRGESNALASSIVLVCRTRGHGASIATRREFTRVLAREIPRALQDMTTGAEGWGSQVAPVDLSQAIIGPGIGLFTRYSSVLEADGTEMSVRTALQLINRYLADDDFDADTQFSLSWFEQFGFASGPYGDAETLAKAKGTSVDGVRSAGVLSAAGGRVQLSKWTDYPEEWDPRSDTRIPVWEVVHHLIRVLRKKGDVEAGRLLAQVQDKAAASRQLAYRLYTLSERAGRADDARAYNELITSWPAVEAAMASAMSAPAIAPTLFDEQA